MTRSKDGPTFADRLAYARFLRHLVHGEAPTDSGIGEAAGRSGQWLTKWKRRLDPMTDFRVHEQLAAYLNVPEEWLIRGIGQPPDFMLWEKWCAARRGEYRPEGHRELTTPMGSLKPAPSETNAAPKRKGRSGGVSKRHA